MAGQSDPLRQSPFHPEHPWLGYYRETFFHIPFLVADQLNIDQDFAGAQRWYHTIFDPTAADGEVWRNRELAEPQNTTTTLRDLLVDAATLDAYRRNPFSPHAIARTRLSAYAKSIVMKYVDNLLDWGDSLFAQFTMESVNEATMLYVMARDILGPRPATFGSCGADGKTRTYREIRPGLSDVSDFLVELETPAGPDAGGDRRAAHRVRHPGRDGAGRAGVEQCRACPAGRGHRAGRPGVAAPHCAAGQPVPGSLGSPASRRRPSAHAQLATSAIVWTSTGGTPLTTLRGGIDGGAPAGGGLTVTAGIGIGTGTGSGATLVPGGGFTDYVRGYGPGAVGTRFGDPLEPFDDLLDVYGLEPLEIKYDLGDVISALSTRVTGGATASRSTRSRSYHPRSPSSASRRTRSCSATGTAWRTASARSATAWTSPARAGGWSCSHPSSTPACSCA